ncbi:MAG TPA: amino acid ABC transporter permease, partial [Blastocatellia bacterium]|nr:amino acid ABC transporter permease [Blastocatellia bacterium]
MILTLFGLALPINAQELRWGGDAEGGAPYLLPNPKNPREIIGFEIDMMNALGKQLNRKSVFVQNQWDGL